MTSKIRSSDEDKDEAQANKTDLARKILATLVCETFRLDDVRVDVTLEPHPKSGGTFWKVEFFDVFSATLLVGSATPSNPSGLKLAFKGCTCDVNSPWALAQHLVLHADHQA